MVRVGLWGEFDGDDVGQMLLTRIVRRELEARLPGSSVRVWTTGASFAPGRFAGTSAEPPMPLGSFDPSRTDELAAAVDLLVIAGRLTLEHPYLVAGVGAVHEPDVPTAWDAVRLSGEPDGGFAEMLGEALTRRAYVSAADASTANRLRTLGAREAEVVPGHALLADRLFRPDEPEGRTSRLRAQGILPEADVLVVQVSQGLVDIEGVAAQVTTVCRDRGLVPALLGAAPGDLRSLEALAARLPDACRLPPTLGLEDVCAIVAWSAGTVATSEALAHVATTYGRPIVRIVSDPADEDDEASIDAIAEAFDRAGEAAATGARAVRLREQIDAHFDRIAALVTDVEPGDPHERKLRSLTSRLASQEAAASARERELEELLAQLTRRVTENDVRFTGLWRKIRECDKHYAWQFDRAERAEERVVRLEAEVEYLRGHPPVLAKIRRAYLALRRRVGALLRRLGLRR